MNAELVRQIQSAFTIKVLPEIRTGMEVEIRQILKEGNKERIQKFRGLVIKTAGKTPVEKAITVRKDVDGIGVETTFLLGSPSIDGIDVLRQFKVRRKNICFIRKLTGKASRLKEIKNIVPTKAKA